MHINDPYLCSDFAVRMLEETETLALSRDSNGYTALHLMALKPYAISPNSSKLIYIHVLNLLLFCVMFITLNQTPFLVFMNFFNGGRMSSSACELIEQLWNQFVKQPELITLLTQPTNLIFDAATVGNAEFLAIIISKYPDLIWMLNWNNQSIFHIAAANRHESVFGLIFELGSAKSRIVELVDNTGCNILHLTARLPPEDRLQVVSGAAFQMQRELLWFEVLLIFHSSVYFPFFLIKLSENNIFCLCIIRW